ncbi:pyrimidine 5'-nucleotidase [Parvularcula lutaonensis]|uniref:Pyrimidine 5'-nucleotidase n=1 Tax=Parvularcula lutaonensis TaxID=491923 RepID=A0ABV7M9B0_9PROT|nr:pyrimidine 5'-nucleotidase [Parvularcula lutaonensis]GGY46872.1 pyrimidine 5'-nucleotidase [Parvularcula lutaonensis]
MTGPLKAGFDGVTDWVFDLDNTLYPAGCNLFAEIDQRMTAYVMEVIGCDHAEARRVQKDLYVEHGTTLAGLMKEHDVDPHAFMDYVHEISLDPLTVDPGLREALLALPGRKFVHTNGSVKHAENVLGALGLTDVMDDIFDVEMGGWVPKPHAQNYDLFRERTKLDPAKAAMFEDMVVNLEIPHEIGMTTVLVTTDAPWIEDEPASKRPGAGHEDAGHIHHITGDLTSFLRALTTEQPETA